MPVIFVETVLKYWFYREPREPIYMQGRNYINHCVYTNQPSSLKYGRPSHWLMQILEGLFGKFLSNRTREWLANNLCPPSPTKYKHVFIYINVHCTYITDKYCICTFWKKENNSQILRLRLHSSGRWNIRLRYVWRPNWAECWYPIGWTQSSEIKSHQKWSKSNINRLNARDARCRSIKRNTIYNVW